MQIIEQITKYSNIKFKLIRKLLSLHNPILTDNIITLKEKEK